MNEGRNRGMDINASSVYEQTMSALEELLLERRKHLNPVKLLVIGCSSSEIAGGTIGHNSSAELGEAVARAALDFCGQRGIDPAFQCCEHLNRALVMPRSAAERRGCEAVTVVPRLKAGGSLATAAWRLLDDPVAVLGIRADAGLDIGQTMIGMHLKRVAIPIRLSVKQLGAAPVTAARTRPKLIGSERAKYTEE